MGSKNEPKFNSKLKNQKQNRAKQSKTTQGNKKQQETYNMNQWKKRKIEKKEHTHTLYFLLTWNKYAKIKKRKWKWNV